MLEEGVEEEEAPETNALGDAESDQEDGLFGLRGMWGVRADKEGCKGGGTYADRRGHCPAWASILVGPGGARETFIKIMIDSRNTVSDLISEEFAEKLGLKVEAAEDKIKVLTTVTAGALRMVRVCWEVPVRLAGIVGEFIIQPLIVRGLTHPVNLGHHFLGR